MPFEDQKKREKIAREQKQKQNDSPPTLNDWITSSLLDYLSALGPEIRKSKQAAEGIRDWSSMMR
jgi:hypothetical protein